MARNVSDACHMSAMLMARAQAVPNTEKSICGGLPQINEYISVLLRGGIRRMSLPRGKPQCAAVKLLREPVRTKGKNEPFIDKILRCSSFFFSFNVKIPSSSDKTVSSAASTLISFAAAKLVSLPVFFLKCSPLVSSTKGKLIVHGIHNSFNSD